MSRRVRSVSEYLEALGESKKDKPSEIKEALQIYIELWKKTIENGVVAATDDMQTALSKVDEAGGLYKASER